MIAKIDFGGWGFAVCLAWFVDSERFCGSGSGAGTGVASNCLSFWRCAALYMSSAVSSPWREHSADQPMGLTWTFIRLPHNPQ